MHVPFITISHDDENSGQTSPSKLIFGSMKSHVDQDLRMQEKCDNLMYAEIALKHSEFRPKPLSTEKRPSALR